MEFAGAGGGGGRLRRVGCLARGRLGGDASPARPLQAAAGGAGDFAAGEELADFVGEGAAAFLGQAEAAEKFGLVGGRVMGLSQKSEQAIAKGHVAVSWRGAQAVL